MFYKFQIADLNQANTLRTRMEHYKCIIANIKKGKRVEFDNGDCFLSELSCSANPPWNKRMRKVMLEAMNNELIAVKKEFNLIVKESK